MNITYINVIEIKERGGWNKLKIVNKIHNNNHYDQR